MKISHKWLQEYFEESIPGAKELAELFTFHSFEVDGVELFEDDHQTVDSVLDLKILPDRAHFCLSYRGIAEELSALTGLRAEGLHINGRQPHIVEDDHQIQVEIEATDFCRRYVARRVSNLNIEESSENIKAKLSAMDGRSINSIVDITNIVMFDTGQPLHAFDADKVKGNIVVRSAKKSERIILLDGREVELFEDDHVIADDEGPLAIAGVKGGKRAEVTMSTKNIIIESANFEPTAVRRTSTRLNLRNESSKRFENEITSEWAMDGMMQVSDLIYKMSPEAKFGPISDTYITKPEMVSILINPEFIFKKLGINIPKERIVEIITSLSIEIEEKGTELKLTIPAHRLDLRIPEDIVEEVGRIYGYDKIEGKYSNEKVEPSVISNPTFYITEHIKNILFGQGFSETYLYTFVPEGKVEVAHPLASDKKALRTNLTDGVTMALEKNSRNADMLFLDSIKIFEIGKIFDPEERTSLCVGIKRIKKVKGQTANEDVRQLREFLLKELEIDVQTLCTIDDTGGLMILKNVETGKSEQIGTINNVDGIMEINLDEIIKYLEKNGKMPSYESVGFGPSPKISYNPFSQYPFIVRDVAVLVPENIESIEVENLIISNAGELMIKHHLFDIFKKDGKTSFAFRLIFQSYERTLTDDEVNSTMSDIIKKIENRGWEVR